MTPVPCKHCGAVYGHTPSCQPLQDVRELKALVDNIEFPITDKPMEDL